MTCNQKTQKDEYVILTLDASTITVGLHVCLDLQECTLRDRFPSKKYKIINMAIVVTNNSKLLNNLKKQIRTHLPKEVIAMVGINDVFLFGKINSLFFQMLHTSSEMNKTGSRLRTYGSIQEILYRGDEL